MLGGSVGWLTGWTAALAGWFLVGWLVSGWLCCLLASCVGCAGCAGWMRRLAA